MIDLRSVIYAFGSPLVITRRAAGQYDATGVYTGVVDSTVTVRASVQPATSTTRPLPEGARREDVLVVYSDSVLFGVKDPDGNPADRFTYNGTRFEVVTIKDWQAGGQGLYCRALCVRVRDEETSA